MSRNKCPCGGTLGKLMMGNRPALQCCKCKTHYYMDVPRAAPGGFTSMLENESPVVREVGKTIGDFFDEFHAHYDALENLYTGILELEKNPLRRLALQTMMDAITQERKEAPL